jgi:hypothetical protein
LKEEALDLTLWRTFFARNDGLVGRQTDCRMNDDTTVNELRVIWNERSGSQLQTVCWYLSGMTEEKHKIKNNVSSSSS